MCGCGRVINVGSRKKSIYELNNVPDFRWCWAQHSPCCWGKQVFCNDVMMMTTTTTTRWIVLVESHSNIRYTKLIVTSSSSSSSFGVRNNRSKERFDWTHNIMERWWRWWLLKQRMEEAGRQAGTRRFLLILSLTTTILIYNISPQDSRTSMLQCKVLIGKFRAVDGLASRSCVGK